jgi:hypothetical protein
MKEGEKYLVLQIGELKIPFFPKTTKDGKKCFQANLTVWVNEKKSSEEKQDSL